MFPKAIQNRHLLIYQRKSGHPLSRYGGVSATTAHKVAVLIAARMSQTAWNTRVEASITGWVPDPRGQPSFMACWPLIRIALAALPFFEDEALVTEIKYEYELTRNSRADARADGPPRKPRIPCSENAGLLTRLAREIKRRYPAESMTEIAADFVRCHAPGKKSASLLRKIRLYKLAE